MGAIENTAEPAILEVSENRLQISRFKNYVGSEMERKLASKRMAFKTFTSKLFCSAKVRFFIKQFLFL